MNCKFPIKDEFPKILNDFTRSILYYNPKDILDFSFKYFYSLENNISLSSTLGTQLNTEISTNNEHKETMHFAIKQSEENLIKDNNNIIININIINNNINNDNNEPIKDNDSKNIKSNNNSENDNKSENNESENSEIDVYMSKDMAKIIKKQRKLKKLKE